MGRGKWLGRFGAVFWGMGLGRFGAVFLGSGILAFVKPEDRGQEESVS